MRRRRRPEAPDVLVFQTGDRAALGLARSLLDSAGIRYVVDSDLIADLGGWGRAGSLYNFIFGPARLYVDKSDADTAREILADIEIARPVRPRWLLVLVWISLIGTAAGLLFMVQTMLHDVFGHLGTH